MERTLVKRSDTGRWQNVLHRLPPSMAFEFVAWKHIIASLVMPIRAIKSINITAERLKANRVSSMSSRWVHLFKLLIKLLIRARFLFQMYFKNRKHLIGCVVGRLQQLREQVLETLRSSSVRFYSTSLLIVTEGCVDTCSNISSDEDDCEDEGLEESDDMEVEAKPRAKKIHCFRNHSEPSSNPGFDIRIIDFAHTCFSSNSSTDGFVHGLDNLIRLLENIRRGQKSSQKCLLRRRSFVRVSSKDSNNVKAFFQYDSGTESRME